MTPPVQPMVRAGAGAGGSDGRDPRAEDGGAGVVAQAVRLAPRGPRGRPRGVARVARAPLRVAGLGLPMPLPRADADAAGGGPRGEGVHRAAMRKRALL